MQRRAWLKAAAALAAIGIPLPRPASAAAARAKMLGKPQPFDYAWLKGRARALAGAAYRPSAAQPNPEVAKLDWDAYQAIRYRDDHMLWKGGGSRFQAAFFHLGLFFTTPVHMHEVVNGMA